MGALLAGAAAVITLVVGIVALADPGGGGDPDDPVDTTAPSAGVQDFDATFDGTPGEGEELIEWLRARESQAVHLDLDFADPPSETDSPLLWSDCPDLPPGEQPSTVHCEHAWVLHIRTDDTGDTADPPFRETRGRHRLEGYFAVRTTAGPNQGISSLALEPISAEAAFG